MKLNHHLISKSAIRLSKSKKSHYYLLMPDIALQSGAVLSRNFFARMGCETARQIFRSRRPEDE